MTFRIIHGDITEISTDAIVNAANRRLLRGGGVCGAIFSKADGQKLQEACNNVAPVPTGGAVLTESFGLPAPYVVHAVGPLWQGGGHGERELLEGAYREGVARAREKGLRSIAFPLLSAGIYGYPYEEALAVAKEVLEEESEDMEITLVLFP